MIASICIGACLISLLNIVFLRVMRKRDLIVLDAMVMLGALIAGMLRHG